MSDEVKNPFTVLVCGGGNAAQVATSMYAARYNTIAISLYADEAEKWSKALGNDEYELTLDTGKVLKSKPDEITNDPKVVAKCDAIVLAVPSFAHGQYFEAFEPYIKPDTVVACMPARSGGDLLLNAKLGAKAETCIFVGFETLPWACRFTEWGRKATILGTKGSILAAVTPPAKTAKAFAALQGLLGVFPNVSYSPSNLGISLRNPGAVIHPGVMYGCWCPEKWDGNPVTEKPLFYQGVEEFSEGVLLGLTNEVQAIRKKMEELVPGLNLKDAVDLKQWYLDCYSGQMTDTSSLRACMNTNPGYRGLTHPCQDADGGKFMPDLKYRYLSEDVPTGMCFNKGLGELLGVPMPMTDKVLAWAQDCIGMKILVDGKMNGPDIAKTRAPQATGISTFEQFLVASKIDKAALAKEKATPAPSLPPPAETEEKKPFCVLVCGGGNAAQVATAMYAARYQTVAISLYADEAAKWKEALGKDEYELTLDTGKVVKSKPDDITNDPSVAAKADAIVLAVPSFAHGQYFKAFAPYMRPNTVVAVMPARSGGDILFASELGAKAKDMIFTGFETLPWACRFTEWGRKATILGTKGSILAAVTPPAKYPQAYAVMQGLLGVFPNVTESPNNLGISLRNPGAVIHPGVMYGRWCPEKWDGKPVAEKPLFYQGVEEFSESVLLALTGEVQAIRKKMEEVAGLDLRDACDLKQWYMDSYAGQMTDTSSLRMCMNTNPGYKGLTHPCLDSDGGKFMPDLKYRYLTEDVPTGMCFNKGLGEILGIPMPMTDKVLGWAQDCIGMKILVDGKMSGPDVVKTRAPQATGISTLAAFLSAAGIGGSSVPRSLGSGQNFKIVFLRHGESVWNVANIFTGWADVDLSPAGDAEAVEAGKCLKEKGYKFDVVFTSVLKRSIKTAWTALMHSDNYSMPIINSWRLNERHYGALQGLNKAETAAKHGDAQVKIWRRSYDIPPPPIELSDTRHPANDPLYKSVPEDALPGAESLKLTVERVLPFWFDTIAPCVKSGRNVLVAAHGNSLRAICKYLEKMSEEEVLELNIPTAVPLVYELDSRLKFVKKYYLLDPEEVAKKVAAVANQGKAK